MFSAIGRMIAAFWRWFTGLFSFRAPDHARHGAVHATARVTWRAGHDPVHPRLHRLERRFRLGDAVDAATTRSPTPSKSCSRRRCRTGRRRRHPAAGDAAARRTGAGRARLPPRRNRHPPEAPATPPGGRRHNRHARRAVGNCHRRPAGAGAGPRPAPRRHDGTTAIPRSSSRCRPISSISSSIRTAGFPRCRSTRRASWASGHGRIRRSSTTRRHSSLAWSQPCGGPAWS